MVRENKVIRVVGLGAHVSVFLRFACLALTACVLVTGCGKSTMSKPPIHLQRNMYNQEKGKAQAKSAFFADGRTMRTPVAGTVPRGRSVVADPAVLASDTDPHYVFGKVDGNPASVYPKQVVVNMTLLRRGQQRFNIYCAACHGTTGNGDSMVTRRGFAPAPFDLNSEATRARPVGELYDMVTNGVRNMAGYGKQLNVADRWAVVAYLRALQRSQATVLADVPPGPERKQLEEALR